MLTFIKLGGSLITDKRSENSFRESVALRIAAEIRTALDAKPDIQLVIGHGSGSFGHVPAKHHNTIAGVSSAEQWRGFAEVALVASELNYLMAKTLHLAGVPVLRFQPSASARALDGTLADMAVLPLQTALRCGLIPLVYGDAVLDDVRGGTIISTERIFFYLAHHLPVQRILLLGEVDGVYDADRAPIPRITPANVAEVEAAISGSSGVDVTGGMETKVRDMLTLVQSIPGLTVRIFNGLKPGLLRAALLGEAEPGTLITV